MKTVYTIRNIARFRDNQLRLARGLQKAGIKSTQEAATLTVVHAKRLAPYYTGETIQGIRSRKIGRGYRAISSVPGKAGRGGVFYQNLWANQRAPYRSPRMRWNRYQPTLYGTGPANYSGTPRFFDRAVQIVQKKFPGIVARNTGNALITRRR